MAQDSSSYLLAGGAAELERLTLQARVWEPEVEVMLDHIGIAEGAQCVDLGCGAMGILKPLSKRVGTNGKVVGVDVDAKQLAAARHFVQQENLSNTEIYELDAYHTELPDASFDFTQVRFVFAPVGRDDELLKEMLRVTKPGGILAIQEPDTHSWNPFPAHPAWHTLRTAILEAFKRGGGDFNAGQRTYHMLRRAGLEDVRIRAAVLALQNNHPYMRSPLQFASSLRSRIVDNNILSAEELDRVVAEVEQIVSHPETVIHTFTVTQVWGRKPTH